MTTSTGAPTTTLPEGCQRLDFDTASVTRSETATGPYTALTVEGHKAPIDQEIRLERATYRTQPAYWEIAVLACGPGTGLPASDTYVVATDIGDTIGIRGIEVKGATRSHRIDIAVVVPPAPPPGSTTETTYDCDQGAATLTLTVVPPTVRAGDTITIDVAARQAPVSAPDRLTGSGVLTIGRPSFVVLDSDQGTSRVTRPLSVTEQGAAAHLQATVATDAKPGDVIDWRAPTYWFTVETDRLVHGTSTSTVITSRRTVRCASPDPDAVLIRQTVVR
jgi:hypothetical protein